MPVKIEWENDVPVKAKEIVQKMVEGLWQSSEMATNVIGNESNRQTPIKKSTLRRSWRVEPLNGQIGFKMSYNTKYAARLHEHPEYNFKTPGTKGKYLEDPIEQNQGDWKGVFLNNLKSVMK